MNNIFGTLLITFSFCCVPAMAFGQSPNWITGIACNVNKSLLKGFGFTKEECLKKALVSCANQFSYPDHFTGRNEIRSPIYAEYCENKSHNLSYYSTRITQKEWRRWRDLKMPSIYYPPSSLPPPDYDRGESGRIANWTCQFAQYRGTSVSESAARTALYSDCILQNRGVDAQCQAVSNSASCRRN